MGCSLRVKGSFGACFICPMEGRAQADPLNVLIYIDNYACVVILYEYA